MNWQNIQLSPDEKSYLINDSIAFGGKRFVEALNFHSPGIAAVKDESGAFHIDQFGEAIYNSRYLRTFGFYDGHATIQTHEGFTHIDTVGRKMHPDFYQWSGNYQEELCCVKDSDGNYFHIDLMGARVYAENYLYAGDFKYGIACVMRSDRKWTHIDRQGKMVHGILFNELGVYHKGFATAKDDRGWFHIDKMGIEIYPHRFETIEPFYNGFSLVSGDGNKMLVGENGKTFDFGSIES